VVVLADSTSKRGAIAARARELGVFLRELARTATDRRERAIAGW
jgi:hypothetical protein